MNRNSALSGNEPFTLGDSWSGHTVLDFWRWLGSDLNNNILRAALGEYIVSMAFDVQYNAVRDRWSAYDVMSKHGLRIEVKTAAYTQTWQQKKPSLICFDVAKKVAEGVIPQIAKRYSDLYVFCIYLANTADQSPLELTNWEFYAVRTDDIDTKLGNQKSITLASLIGRLPYQKLDFSGLCSYADKVDASISDQDKNNEVRS